VRAGAPAHAVGAIIREHLGPSAGYNIDFAGYDALLFVNLTAGGLADPMGDDPAGTDTAFMSALLTGGTEAQLFGSGAATLGLLDAEAIWETLIPIDGDFINASADGTVPLSVTRWLTAVWPIWSPCRNRRRWRCSASVSWDWCWLAGGRGGRSCNGVRTGHGVDLSVLERFGRWPEAQGPASAPAWMACSVTPSTLSFRLCRLTALDPLARAATVGQISKGVAPVAQLVRAGGS